MAELADQLAERVRLLGFVCDVVDQGAGRRWLRISKLRATPGNRLMGGERIYEYESGGRTISVEIDSPQAGVRLHGAQISFDVTAGVPSSPGAYQAFFESADAVLEEVVHYYFDRDSRMSVEDGFEPGPGRPPK